MSKIFYYMTLFPTEALIASMLTPEQFGAYMATGYKSGSHEQLIFAEVTEEFGTDFDWAYAHQNTVPDEKGKPKHSVYLSVYRVLERTPLDKIGDLYLTTSDGQTLGITKSVEKAQYPEKPYYLYQNLCPANPLVVSAFSPDEYGKYMVSESVKISLPALCYCDLKVIDVQDPVRTGNIGPMYDRNIGHLNECIKAVTVRGKKTKMLERTFAGRFTYQIVQSGFTIVNRTGRIHYAMPGRDILVKHYYNWAYSAMII
jgi:hypothetical protein